MMDRREFLRTNALTGAAALLPAESGDTQTRPYQIGAYYFPNFHVDPVNEETHGRGWTEWEILKRGEPKFPGHQQPRTPMWGYQDESDPAVFEKKIDAAADHGLNYFIFDWYWYRGRPFLNRALEKGFFGAKNNSRLKFCLMWANHNWMNLFPARLHMPSQLQYEGAVTPDQFEVVTDYIIKTYFSHPSYWKINGEPYFSVYELFRLIQGLGGAAPAARALDRFRKKTTAAGFPGLHLNAVAWGVQALPGTEKASDPKEYMDAVQIDSTTSYTWIHHVELAGFPKSDYATLAEKSFAYWPRAAAASRRPYFPNVSMGWDSSPRTCQSDVFTKWDYPFLPVVTQNTPEAFREGLVRMRKFLDAHPASLKTFNINAWNEWTEGSYLEPDTVHKYAYLEAIKDAFAS